MQSYNPAIGVHSLKRLTLDNIEWSQIGHLMNFTQPIISITERDWNVEAEETKTTERPLWREHSRELSTDLQWLGLSTELKTVSFQIL